MDDPQFAHAFSRETHALQVDRLRVALTVGVGLYLSFWILDVTLAPAAERWVFLAIRLAVSLLAGLTVVATYTELGKRHVTVLAVTSLLMASFGISWMTVRLTGFASSYYAGNMLVLFFAGLFMPWSLITMIAFCALLCGGYFGLNALFSVWSVEALSPAFFLIGTSAFTCLANISSRNSRIRDLELRMKLEHANLDLQRVGEAKTRFFSNVSHELRTPLMLIVGPLEALRNGNRNHAQLLATMSSNAQRLLRQVNMLLDFAKVEAGRLQCRPRQIHVGEIVQQLVDAAQPFAVEREIRLTASGLAELPETDADPEQVETMAANLLSNALKFTSTRGTVEVLARASADHIEVSVRDTGRGIPADELNAIFDRFHQVEGDNRPEGTGLGLALVKELATLHRGEVTVNSVMGEGSTFTLRLPRVLAMPAERRRTPRRHEDRVARALVEGMLEQRYEQKPGRKSLLADLRGASQTPANDTDEANVLDEGASRILLVEDNQDLRQFVGSELARRYHVETAVDGQDGLEKARLMMPDAIVSDWMMPRMDGPQLCQKLKADPLLAATPIILLTAKAGSEAVVAGLRAGADDYVTKPFDMSELCARIDAHLRSRALERKLTERESRLAAIGQFTSTVAHDIRSPLQAVVGYIDLAAMQVRDFDKNSPALEDLDTAQKACARAEAMMQKVVEFARSGSLSLQMESVDAGALLEEIHRDLHPVLWERGVTLHFEASGDLRMKADPLQLRRVIENLIGNARDAVQGQQTRAIWLRGSEVETGVCLSVADSGPGIAESMEKTLFQPFTTGEKTGFGLGLSIASNLVVAHGGKVQVVAHSAHGGAEFVLQLPREIPEELTRAQIPPSASLA